MMKKRLIAIALLCMILIAGVYYFHEPLTTVTFKLKGFDSQVTPHFIILFKPESRDCIPAVVSAAEKTYDIVGKDFGFYPKNKIPIVVFPDRLSLQSAFNWPEDENTQGVYYRGIIYVQSPGAWIENTQDMERIFFEKGPMVHEYTHLVVDALTASNHPRWLTEGVAQYEERRVTGYTLDEDFDIDRDFTYAYEDIMHSFDNLPDVPRAYLGALEMTDVLAGNDGIHELKRVMLLLKNGHSANGIFLRKAAQFEAEGKSRLVTNIVTNGGVIFERENSSGG
jgi:hypothetical protein